MPEVKKVLMMPSYIAENPYLIQLKEALKKENIEVLFFSGNRFFFPIFLFLMKNPFEIIHIHWIHKFIFSYKKNLILNLIKSLIFRLDLYLVKNLLKVKIVWTCHNLYSHNRKFLLIEKRAREFFIKQIDKIIVHCNRVIKYLQKEFNVPKRKIEVIPHGNYMKSYQNQIDKIQARKKLNLDKKDLVYLFFGTIKPYKNVDDLINNFLKFKENEKIKLMIVGNPLNNEIKKRILNKAIGFKNIITHLQFVPKNKVELYFNASDILIFPYTDILASGVIYLAITFGKPIIAPKIGCIPDILNDEGAFLYDITNKKGLKHAMQRALEKREILESMGEYNFKISKELNWDKIGLETKKIYQSIITK